MRMVGSLLGILSLVVLTTGAAPGVTPTHDDPSVSAVEQAAPEIVELAVPAVELSSKVELQSDTAEIEVSKDPEVGVSMETAAVQVTIQPPSADTAEYEQTVDGSVVFDNNDNSSTVVLAGRGGDLTFVSVLENEAAPTRYEYVYSGIDELRQHPQDGGVTAWSSGEQVGYFLEPWAIDASGNEVPTWYEVDGLRLTQVVDHTSSTWAYPIAADPTQNMGGNSFYSNITLDINPTAATVIVRVTPAPNINWARLPRSTGLPPYNALVPSSYEGRKYHDQLVCHWESAGYFKTPWNLDSWRPDVGYTATVFQLCNPN